MTDQPTRPNPVLGTFFNTLTAKPLAWLWPDRIPLGHLTLLDSPPGLGASRLALDLAASVTSGHPLPDGAPCTQGPVLLIAPNDSPTDTILPRLQAAGADLSHILLLNSVPDLDPVTHTPTLRPLTLPDDFGLLEQTITELGARLLIIDPLATVFTRSRARHPRPWTHRPYTALAHLAQRTGCAILLIRTLSKAPVNPTLPSHGPGGLELLCAARSALLLCADPNDKDLCYLMCTKHSLSHEPPTLAYQRSTNSDNIPTLLWLGESEPPRQENPEQDHILSIPRDTILRILRDYSTPLDPKTIASLSMQSEESTRKILQRMRHAGQLIQPAYGLYTTPDHPCLADFPNSTPAAASPSPVPPTQQDPIFPGGYLPDIYTPIPVLTPQDPAFPGSYLPASYTLVPPLQASYGRDSSRPVVPASQPPVPPVQPAYEPDEARPVVPASQSPVPPVQPSYEPDEARPVAPASQPPVPPVQPTEFDLLLTNLEEATHLPIRQHLHAFVPPPVIADTSTEFDLLLTELEEATHLPIRQHLQAYFLQQDYDPSCGGMSLGKHCLTLIPQ